MKHIILPVSFVHAPIRVDDSTLSMVLPIFPVSVVPVKGLLIKLENLTFACIALQILEWNLNIVTHIFFVENSALNLHVFGQIDKFVLFCLNFLLFSKIFIDFQIFLELVQQICFHRFHIEVILVFDFLRHLFFG